MVIYYDDRRVRVTSAELRVDGIAYRLDELTHVWHRRRAGTGTLSRQSARTVLMLVGGGLGLACFCVASTVLRARLWFRHDLMGLVLLVVGFLVGAAVTWPLWELMLSGMDRLHIHGVDTHELWVRRGDEDLLLLRTSDALRFGQIYRALGRALEAEF